MFRLLLSALLALGVLGAPASAQQKDAPKKDAPAKAEPAKGQVVKVKSVDDKTKTLVVVTPDGKTMTFKVEKEVNIVGPRGGKREDRLKDDMMAPGSEITLFMAADGKSLKEIKLSVRKPAPPKDKKEPEKDKDKKPIKDK